MSGAACAGGGDAALERKTRPRPGLISGVKDRAMRCPPEQPRKTLRAGPVDWSGSCATLQSQLCGPCTAEQPAAGAEDADAAQPRLRKISGFMGAAWGADLSLGYLCSRAARAHLPTNSTTADRLGESARCLRVGNSSFRGFYEPNLANMKPKITPTRRVESTTPTFAS